MSMKQTACLRGRLGTNPEVKQGKNGPYGKAFIVSDVDDPTQPEGTRKFGVNYATFEQDTIDALTRAQKGDQVECCGVLSMYTRPNGDLILNVTDWDGGGFTRMKRSQLKLDDDPATRAHWGKK